MNQEEYMEKFVEANTFERYNNLDAINNEDRRKELFDAVHERNNHWNQYRLFL
jgi:hypothetical protein